MRRRSAPRIRSLGTMVSSVSSCADTIATRPLGASPDPSGHGAPTEMRAAMSSDMYDLPRSGLPASNVTFALGIRRGHSHSPSSGVTVSSRLISRTGSYPLRRDLLDIAHLWAYRLDRLSSPLPARRASLGL